MSTITFCNYCPLDISELLAQLKTIQRALSFQDEKFTPEQSVAFKILQYFLGNNPKGYYVEHLHTETQHQCVFKVNDSAFYFSRPISYSDCTPSNVVLNFTKFIVHPDPLIDADIENFHNRFASKSERHLLFKDLVLECISGRSRIDQLLSSLNIQTRFPPRWRSQVSADEPSWRAIQFQEMYPEATFLDGVSDRENFEYISCAALDHLRRRVASSTNQLERARLLRVVACLTRMQKMDMSLHTVQQFSRDSYNYNYMIAGHRIAFYQYWNEGQLTVSISRATSDRILQHFHDDGYSSEAFDVNVNLGLDWAGSKTLIDTLMNSVKATIGEPNVYQMLTSFCTNMFVIWRNLKDPITVGLSLINVLSHFKVSFDLAIKAADAMKDHFFQILSFFKTFRAQADDAYLATKALLMPIVATIMTFLTVIVSSKLPNQKDITEALNRMSSFGRAISGFEKTYTFLGEWVSKAFDVCYSKICGMPKEALDIEPYIADIKVYFAAIQEVVQRASFDDITTSPALCDKVEALYKQGLRYSQQLSLLKLTSAQMQPFYTHFRELSKLYTAITTRGARYFSPRTEPAVIHLYGNSGVGKSGLVFLLAQDLLATEGLEDEVIENIYMRQVEQEFWDGYQGQKICVYDDFGQRTDSSSKPNEEFMEIIRTGNIIPMMCHMADIHEKKTTPFISKGMILTSNANTFDIKSLICPSAYKRRRQVVAEVHIVDAYGKLVLIDGKPERRLDKTKLKDLPVLADEVYQFHVVDPDTGTGEMYLDAEGRTRKKMISYDEFAKICQEAYISQYEDSKDRIDYLQIRAQKFKSQADEDNFNLAEVAAVKYFYQINDPDSVIDINLPKSFSVFDSVDFSGKSCAEIMDYILQNYPKADVTVPHVSKSVREILHAYYVEGKELATTVSNKTSSLLASLSKRFIQVLNYRLNPENPENFVARHMGNVVVGLCTVITGFALYYQFNKFKTNLKEVWKATEPREFPIGTLEECKLRQCLDEEWSVLTSTQAKLLFSCLCNSSCTFCNAVRDHHGDLSCDLTNEAAMIAKAQQLYEDAEALSFKEAFEDEPTSEPTCEGKKYDSARTNSKKTMKTEGRKYDAARTSQKKTYRTENRQTRGMTSEAVYDQNQNEIIHKKLLRNMYRVYVPSSNTHSEWKPIVNITFVKDRKAIVPTHAVSRIRAVPKIKIRNTHCKDGLVFDTTQLDFAPILASRVAADIRGTPNLEKDASIIQFPIHLPMHRCITHLFVTNQELSTIQSCRATLVTYRDQFDDIVFEPHTFPEVKARDTFSYQHDEINGKERVIALRDCWEYQADTAPGDCGSPLVLSSPLVKRKIVGFHIAGCPGKGVSNSLSAADLERAFGSDSNDWRSHCTQVAAYVNEDKEPTLPKGDFIPIGKIDRNMRGNGKTKLRESPLQGALTFNDGACTTAPAALSRIRVDGVLVDPLEKGLRKCGVPTKHIDENVLDSACISFSSKLYDNIDPRHKTVLTHEESISGLPNDNYAEPINRRSSPGWPWINDAKGTLGKTKWLGDGEEYIYDNEELCQAINLRIENAKKGIRTPTYWIDTLKDERRPLEKVALGKTRVFAAGAMDYVIAFRRYFLGFNAHIMKEKIDNEIAVGINVYSPDWCRLGKYLQRQGQKVIAGDFSNFDGTLNPQILHKICDLINDWYDDGEENARVRKVLWEEIVSSHHIFEDNVYSWTHSQPSGNPATVIINSCYNSISMRVVWLNIMKNTPFPSLAHFNKYVNMISFGDDNVLNINDEVIAYFNQITIAEGYADIGMTYTDEGKTGELVSHRSLSDVKFLKRGFYETEGTILAPLDLDVIMEMCLWVKTDVNVVENTITNVETALRELSLHPRHVFDVNSKDLIRACRANLPRQPQLFSYADYRLQDFDQYY